jgi:serine protease Do
MADYCDILRSHNADDTLSLDVLRYETGERLEGQLNGRELEMVSVPVVPTSASSSDEPDTLTYSGYTLIADDSLAIQVEVPVEWSDVDGSAWMSEGEQIGVTVSASTDLVGFNDTYETPGMFFGASRTLATEYDVNGLLDALDFSDDCTFDGRYEYDDGVYVGYYDLYIECGSAQSTIASIAAVPEDGTFIVWVLTQLVNDRDVDAFGQIIDTFQVVDSLP